jgi:hypothetical protein
MSNRVVTVTKKGWLSRLFSSIGGVFLGVLLFFGPFIVLWMNEGRADMSKVSERSMAVDAAAVNPAAEGQLVAVSGRVVSDERLGDAGYLQPGAYMQLERQVEMYAWIEKQSSETETAFGGGERTITRYDYERGWTASPARSSNFQEPAGHENPELTIERQTRAVSAAQIGAYNFDPQRITWGGSRRLDLNEEMIVSGAGVLANNYLFIGRGTLQQPLVGDVRLSYTAVPANLEMTVFGRQQGARIAPFTDNDNNTLYRAFVGDRESAIATLSTEHKTTGWILRGVGFLMMWIGLSLIFAPLTIFLDVLPILGRLSRTIVGLITFVVAFGLAALTSLIAMIVQSLLGLICIGSFMLFVVVGVGAAAVFLARQGKEKAAAV